MALGLRCEVPTISILATGFLASMLPSAFS